MFERELDFFIANQKELVEKYQGKYLAIKGEKVIGVYSSAMDAYFTAQKEHELGSFMIQPCEPGPDAYTMTIVSEGLVSF